MSNSLRFIFIGDLVGSPGISLFQKWAQKIKAQYKADAIIVNGENSDNRGMGIKSQTIDILKAAGADLVTLGNHSFDQKDVYQSLNDRSDIIRPINYPSGCPGKGYSLLNIAGHTVAVVNLHGRVFTREVLDCPFKAIDSVLTFLRTKTNIIFVDFHAEATSEKAVMGFHLDGRVSGVVGTHTHVQTADQKILPKGTAYITDLGCCGALNSAIGMKPQGVLNRFLIHHKFGKFEVETDGPMVLSGVIIEVNSTTGKALSIEPIRIIDEEISKHLK